MNSYVKSLPDELTSHSPLMMDNRKRSLSSASKNAPKRKKDNRKGRFQINAKSFYLTYACPKDKLVMPLTRESILYFFHTSFPGFDIVVIVRETHENFSYHFHVFIQNTSPSVAGLKSKNCRIFDIDGIHPNFGKRKDGNKKYSKHDFLEYCMKEDTDHIAMGIDVALYLEEFKKKQSTKLSIIARDIYHNGLDLAKMCAGEHASVVLMHEDKLKKFAATCERVKYEPMKPKFIPKRAYMKWHPVLIQIAKWWNYRIVQGKWKKKYHCLYLWSIFFSLGKSTLIRLMCIIMNGSNYMWAFNDKGWQEGFRNRHRVIGVDALSGPYFPFTTWEAIGSNFEHVIKQRQEKFDNIFKGPLLFTSNDSIENNYKTPEGKRAYNVGALLARTFQLNIQNVPLFPLVNYLAKLHGIDPKIYMEENDGFSLDEGAAGNVQPLYNVQPDIATYFTTPEWIG